MQQMQQQSDEKEDAEEEETVPEGVRWKVGDVIKHATYGYTGISQCVHHPRQFSG